MLTPQEVSTHSFAKASFGGYNMAMVDEFLDELTDDYTALYKENAALKAKLKVLVEKVEEYRAGRDRRQAEDQLPEKRGCRRGGTSAERQGGTGEVFCCRPGCVR